MSIYQELDYNPDIERIKGVQFSIFSPEEIRRRSVAEIFTQETYENDKPKIGGLFDPRMGVLDHGKICPTDKLDNRHSPGYFGHIELSMPVFNNHFMKYITSTLKCVCWKCSKLLIDINSEQIQNLSTKKGINKFIIIGDLCSKIKRCGESNNDGCGTPVPDLIRKDPNSIGKIMFQFNSTGEGGTKQQIFYNAKEILKIFKRITDDECEIMGFSRKFCRPDWLICSVFPIAPPSVRPSVRSDSNTRMEDDLTHKICDIIKTNRTLKTKLENDSPQKVIDEWYQLLQYHVATFVDNTIPGIPPAQQRSGRPLKSVKERLKSKEGRVRGNLMGKRVDFSARSVITPDPNLGINELGVPFEVAKNLTFPEIATVYNKMNLNKMVINGYDKYPGAKSIKRKSDGKIISLKIISDYELQTGDIVNRHLIDGDYVLFNRQPSLHKMSMMAHKIKVLPCKTFRLNVSVTTPYNADFDGDEMNMHVPQSLQTMTELKELCLVQTQIITPAQHKPIIALVQDSIIGAYLLTHYSNYLRRDEVSALLASIPSIKELPSPDIKKNTREEHLPDWFPKYKYFYNEKVENDLWSGRTIFSLIIPDINLQKENESFTDDAVKYYDRKLRKNINLNYVVIKSGQIIQGVLDKSILGTKDGGLIHIVHNQFGAEACQILIDNIQNLLTTWMLLCGFSVGLGDLLADAQSHNKMKETINDKKKNVIQIINHIHSGILENNTGKTNAEEFESQVLQNLNQATADSGKIGSKYLDSENRMTNIVNSGSKGSQLNIGQMIACVGQQAIDGKRIPYGYTDRTLPHFHKYDDGSAARGFVENSFVQGLTPTEFYFHAMGGREGLIDTAVKTSETGYIQRKLVKGMEDLKIHFDYTVRNSNNGIIQFLYGEDGIDPVKIEKQSLPIITMTLQEIEKNYRINVKDFKKYLDENAYKTFTNQYAENKNIQLEFDQYVESLLKDQKYIIEKVNKNNPQNGNTVYYSINLKRILDNTYKYNGNIHKTDLTPVIVLEKIKELHNKIHVNNNLFKENRLFMCLVKCYLSPNNLIKNYKITISSLDIIITTIIEQFHNSIAEPGELVGVISAQSIGEPSTQMTLNTFHFAGISSKSQVTRGLPRFKELLSATRNVKSPYNTIYLKDEYSSDKEISSRIMNELAIVNIKQIINSCEIFHNSENKYSGVDDDLMNFYTMFNEFSNIKEDDKVNPWVLRLTFDKRKMLDKDITMNDIYYSIISEFNSSDIKSDENISCIYSDDNAANLCMRIQIITKINENVTNCNQEDIICILKEIENTILNNIVLKGISDITNVSMSKQDNIYKFNQNSQSYDKVSEWVIDTEGSNLIDLFKHPAINFTKTISNDIHEILETLGIEAARNILIDEITDIFEQSSSYVNYRHIALLSDVVTNKGILMSIDRHGINKSDRGPLAKCSFEETSDIIAKAAIFGEVDNMNGVSANIMLGQETKCGTGFIDILFDEEKNTEIMQNMTYDNLSDSESDNENSETMDNFCSEENITDNIFQNL